MPTQINEPPSQQGAYPPVPYSPVPNAPWLQQDDDDLDLTQLIRIVRRRGWIIAGIAITVASAFWGWTLTRTPIYRGEFRVLIESVDEANPSQELLLDERSSFGSTVDYDTQIEVLQSSALLQPITNELQERYPSVSVREIADNLSINRLRETKVLQISYRGTETQRIQDILEEIAQQYLEYSFEQRQASLSQGIEFVDDQLPELRDRVNNLQVQVERFRQQYSLLDPNSRGDDLSELISRVEDERQQLQTELSQARSLFQNLQDQLNVSPEEALAAATLSESPRYQSLLNQVQELEAQLAIDSAKYQPNSPQIAALRERRDNLLPILEAEAVDILGQRFAVGASDNVDGNLTPTSINLGRQLIDAANDVQMLQARSETLAQVEQGLKQEFALVPGLARQYTDMQRE
ncbi:MAG: Wzz/FepE/Etk N-terminal domain-containing protein, partial [Cyanobacteria bacterium J06627_8]